MKCQRCRKDAVAFTSDDDLRGDYSGDTRGVVQRLLRRSQVKAAK